MTSYSPDSTLTWVRQANTSYSVANGATDTSLQGIVDGDTTTLTNTGFFKPDYSEAGTLYKGERIVAGSYIQFTFPSDVVLNEVIFYLQHHLWNPQPTTATAACYFMMDGVSAAGVVTNIPALGQVSRGAYGDQTDYFVYSQNPSDAYSTTCGPAAPCSQIDPCTGSTASYVTTPGQCYSTRQTWRFTFDNSAAYRSYRWRVVGGYCNSPVILEAEFPSIPCASAPTFAPTNDPTRAPTRNPTAVPVPPTFSPTGTPSFGPCSLPAFGAGVVSAPGYNCGSSLAFGASCVVACASGYTANSGTTVYTCGSGSLSATASVICTPNSCTFPSLPTGQIAGALNGCVAGGTVAHGSSCTVQCNTTRFVSLGGTTTYTCSAGALTAATLTCQYAPCTLPTPLANNALVQGVANTTGCGTSLASESSCFVQCISGYSRASGSTNYTCTNAALTNNATLTCAESSCTLPSSFGSRINGAANSGCVANGSLPSGASCTVECATGMLFDTGNTAYSCLRGSLTAATLRCKSGPCPVPFNYGTGIVPATTNGCPVGLGAELNVANPSCNVSCAPGYSVKSGQGTYNCTFGILSPATLVCSPNAVVIKLPAGVQGGGAAPCVNGMSLASGSSCSVECAPGFKYSGGTTIYSVVAGFLAATPTIQCVGDGCLLPDSVGAGVVAVPGSALNIPCQLGGYLQHQQKCFVQCDMGYSYSSGTTAFECTSGVLDSPSLACKGNPCNLPIFGEGVVGSKSSGGCTAGQTLMHGQACEVQCDNGGNGGRSYSPAGGTTLYGCKAGVLTSATLKCAPSICNLGMLGEGVSMSSNTPVSPGTVRNCSSNLTLLDGQQCQIACQSGYTLSVPQPKCGDKYIDSNYVERIATPPRCGTAFASCSGITLTPATAYCKPKDCVVPSNFSAWAPGYRGGNIATEPGKAPCIPGEPLLHGGVCTISCLPGWEEVVATAATKADWTLQSKQQFSFDIPLPRSNEFSCRAGTVRAPTMQCRPSTCKYVNKAWPGWSGCFDSTYPCEACCTTGFNLQGKPCFPAGGQYSHSKCCTNSAPIASPAVSASCGGASASASTITSLPAGSPSCANPLNPKSPQCFDSTYTCKCCETGFTAGGLPCWDKYYKREDCCASTGQSSNAQLCSCVQLRNPGGLCYAYAGDDRSTQFETCDKARVSQCFIPIANNAFQVYLSPAQCADGSSVNSQEFGPRLQARPCGGVTRAYQSLNAAEKKMGNAPVEVVGAGNVSPFSVSSVSECVKDPQCFDAEYTCESCCQTGRSATLGLACWNSQFNAAACCRSPASGAASTVAALFSAVAPGTLVDSRGNAAAVDSRGYAAGSAGFDSRGRPVDQPDSSATAGIDAPASNVAAIASECILVPPHPSIPLVESRIPTWLARNRPCRFV